VQFTFGAVPSVTSVEPGAGPISGGTRVAVTGTGFSTATRVLFGGVPGTRLHVLSPTALTVLAPRHAAAALDVRVVSAFGRSAAQPADRFIFAAAPTITEVSPSSGPTDGGTQVTVTGAHLDAVTELSFGGVAASGLVHVSATTLTVISPAHPAGKVPVVASGPGGDSADGPGTEFTYVG
jgi:hypothetical protein